MTPPAQRPARWRSARLWAAMVALVLVLIALLEIAITGPRVTVLWRADMAPAERLALERRYDLQGPEPQSDAPGTWQYRLGDWSRENVERLVRDPAAEDTGYIDRSTFTAEDPAVRVSLRPWLAVSAQNVRGGVDEVRRPIVTAANRVGDASRLLLPQTGWLLLVGGLLWWATRATSP